MLTIKDLSASKELDRDAMATVRGGFLPDVLKIINTPVFDLSSDLVLQEQISVIDQSGNWGGVNLAFNYQNQEAAA